MLQESVVKLYYGVSKHFCIYFIWVYFALCLFSLHCVCFSLHCVCFSLHCVCFSLHCVCFSLYCGGFILFCDVCVCVCVCVCVGLLVCLCLCGCFGNMYTVLWLRFFLL